MKARRLRLLKGGVLGWAIGTVRMSWRMVLLVFRLSSTSNRWPVYWFLLLAKILP